MNESYAFMLVFALQILAFSVLHPTLLIRYLKVKAAEYPPERFPQLYTGVFGNTQRFVSIYRALNSVVAMVGAGLLAWLFVYMQRPEWRWPTVFISTIGYFIVQFLPLVWLVVIGIKQIAAFQKLPQEPRRKAVLQRRGLFDFVSPTVVIVALLVVVAFIAFMIHAIHFRVPAIKASTGYFILGVVMLSFVLSGMWTYKAVYGKKLNPFESHADRMHTIGLGVRGTFYTGIAVDVYLPILFTLELSGLQSWMPIAQSGFLGVFALLLCVPFMSLPPEPARAALKEVSP
jgi:MFS family permease